MNLFEKVKTILHQPWHLPGYVGTDFDWQSELGLRITDFAYEHLIGGINWVDSETTISGANVIYASNHTSWMDVFVLQDLSSNSKILAAPSVMFWVGILFGGFLNCISEAKGDVVRACAAWLVTRDLIICPEGWINWNRNNKCSKFRSGVIRIAQRAKVPIIPVKIIYGKYPGQWIEKFPWAIQFVLSMFTPHRKSGVCITIGLPFEFDFEEDPAQAVLRLQETIDAL